MTTAHSPQPRLAGNGGPLFLVGMPRSGTKLLRDLLNRNPWIGIPEAETEFLPYLAHRISRFGDLADRKRFDVFYAHFERLSYFHWRRLAGRQVSAEQWYSACRSFDTAGVFEALIRVDADCPHDGKRIWGDKSPSYMNDIHLLNKLYPTCCIVHIVRDVRDYCVSIRRAWGKNMLRAAQRWADGLASVRIAGGNVGSRYIEVRYEDLLTSPERELRRICELLGVEFDAAMLSLDRPSENRGNARGQTRIVCDNLDNYKTKISPEFLERIENIAGNEMKRHGYTLATSASGGHRLSRPHMAALQFLDAIQLARVGLMEKNFAAGIWYHVRYFLTTRG